MSSGTSAWQRSTATLRRLCPWPGSASVGLALGLAVIGLVTWFSPSVVRGAATASSPPAFQANGCAVSEFRFQVPTRATLRKAFPVSAAPVGLTVDQRGRCDVVATLSTDDEHIAIIGDPRLRVNLATTALLWNVTSNGVDNRYGLLRLHVIPATPCPRPSRCESFFQEKPVRIYRDEAHVRAQAAFDAYAAAITAAMSPRPGHPEIRPGVSSTVDVDVFLPEPVPPVGIEDLTMTTRTLRIPGDDGAPRTTPLTGGPQKVRWPFEVTPPHARNFEALVSFHLDARWQNIRLSAETQVGVEFDVREEPWFKRWIIDNLAWISLLVGIVVGVATLLRKKAKDAGE